jgi:hypothetical protein
MPKTKIVGALLVAASLAFAGTTYAAAGSHTSAKKKATHRHVTRRRSKSADNTSPASSNSTMTPAQTYAYWTKARMKSAGPPQTNVSGGPQSGSSSPPSGGNRSSGKR